MNQKSEPGTFPAIIILVIFLTACNPQGFQTCLETGEAFPEPVEGENTVEFTIENNTCMSICEVLVSPDNCEYMGGKDWVENHPLRSGESVTQSIPQGRYAVWVELCTDEFRADEHIRVFDDKTHTVDDSGRGSTPPCGTSLNIINKTDVPICRLWISNSGSIYDSRNWIGTDQIMPGEELYLTLRPDTYNIKAEDCESSNLRFEGDVFLSGHQNWVVE